LNISKPKDLPERLSASVVRTYPAGAGPPTLISLSIGKNNEVPGSSGLFFNEGSPKGSLLFLM
jgi:hypothetical protein